MPEETVLPLQDKNAESGTRPEEAVVAAAGSAGEEKSTVRTGPRGTGPHGPSWLAVAALCLLVSLFTSAGSVYIYDHYYAQKVVSLDIKGYIANQRDLYLAGKIDGKQFRANIDKLEAVVKSIPKNRVVIMGDAVVKGAKVEKLPD